MLVCVALSGCHRDIRTEDAVRQGVLDYLATRQGLNISSMNVTVASMVFRENEVDATVNFAPKDSAAAQPMTIHYVLQKKGDRWVVKPRVDAGGGNPHGGGMGASPHGGMGMPGAGGAPGGTLPPGHPTVPPQNPPK